MCAPYLQCRSEPNTFDLYSLQMNCSVLSTPSMAVFFSQVFLLTDELKLKLITNDVWMNMELGMGLGMGLGMVQKTQQALQFFGTGSCLRSLSVYWRHMCLLPNWNPRIVDSNGTRRLQVVMKRCSHSTIPQFGCECWGRVRGGLLCGTGYASWTRYNYKVSEYHPACLPTAAGIYRVSSANTHWKSTATVLSCVHRLHWCGSFAAVDTICYSQWYGVHSPPPPQCVCGVVSEIQAYRQIMAPAP